MLSGLFSIFHKLFLTHKRVVLTLLVVSFLSLPTLSFAANPSSPFSPSDNVTDPNCLPTDSNCYVSITSMTFVNATSTNLITTSATSTNFFSTLLNAVTAYFTTLSTTGTTTLATAGGRVGVGTTTPSSLLDVWGNLSVGTSSISTLFVNTATGRVGVGTTSPSHKLDVNGVVNATDFYKNGVLFTGSGGTPANTIASFNQATCPTGWILADGTSGTPDLRGIYIRGAGISGSYTKAAGGAYSATFGTFQEDAFQGHRHSVSAFMSYAGGGSASFNPAINTATTFGYTDGANTSDGTNGTPRISNETRPASYALIYCMKTSEDADTTSSIWGTSGTSIFLQDASKNVGVGTTSPTSLLTIASSTATGLTSLFSVATSTTLFNIFANGNIGIGTSTPGSKLDIWGNLTVGTSSTPLIFANTATGNVGIGTANPSYRLSVDGRAGEWAVGINGSGAQDYGLLARGTAYSGYFLGPGYINQGAWTYGSDRRLKENISYFESGLDTIMRLKPAAYDYISGTKSNLGFIAQDVQEVIPEAVTITDPTTGMLGLKTEFIIPYLVNAVQNMNSVFNATNALNASSTIFSYYQGTTTPAITVGATGNVAIATSSSMHALTVGNSLINGVIARFQNATGYCDINPTTTSLTCSSDERLKKNILSLDATSTFDKFIQLNPVTYNWIGETSTSTHAGFIAQQVETLFPDLVATDEQGMKSVSYTGFIPYIIESVKTLAAEVKALTVKVAAFGDLVRTRKVETDTLCVGQTCLTESQLKTIMESLNVQSEPNAPEEEENDTTTTASSTEDDQEDITETSTSTTETLIEPLPETVVEPSTATSTEETPTE